jgi:SsrA-binding protein
MVKANGETISENRRASYDYYIEETYEAGIMLLGSEVKSLRLGKASILEAHASEKNGDILLFNATITEYPGANRFNHEPKRPRILLLRKREKTKLINAVQRKGMTMIPLSLYFNSRGLVKLKLGLAKGKRQVDKRAVEKERDWKREKERILKNQE